MVCRVEAIGLCKAVYNPALQVNRRAAIGFIALCQCEVTTRGFGDEGLVRAEGFNLKPIKASAEHAELECIGQAEFGQLRWRSNVHAERLDQRFLSRPFHRLQ